MVWDKTNVGVVLIFNFHIFKTPEVWILKTVSKLYVDLSIKISGECIFVEFVNCIELSIPLTGFIISSIISIFKVYFSFNRMSKCLRLV